MTSRGTKYWNAGAIPLIAPDLLGDIIATASDIAIVISPEAQVLSVLVNPNHPYEGRLDHWKGRNLRDYLTAESQPKLERELEALAAENNSARPVELNHVDRAEWEFPVRYTFHCIGPDGAYLMLGRDLRPIAEMQQQLVKAQLALEKDYEAQRDYDTRFRVLLETTRDPFVFVSLSNGRITDCNGLAAKLLATAKETLVGSAFAQEFEGRRRSEFIESLTNAAVADGAGSVELQARRTGRTVTLTPTIFRAAGERILLCRIDPTDEVDQLSDELSENLGALYQEGVDAIAFTDGDGTLIAANDSFLKLIDVAHLTVAKGKSLADFLVRGNIDLKVLLENAARSGQMRMYATKLQSEYGSQISVEISVTLLNDRANPAYVFVIRDASRAEAVRRPGAAVSNDAVRSVMELVGSATLKDIVAETTDVVEKMCIETAIELTRNNRVAAAEMLGLSRQSLYVKLRKYGLIARNGES
ncbi:MAG: transcriptional regulator PpsR [Rhodobacteraceae bacterium]|nr:transcriptional regulator PpsR [Paracoccaceae bacterium]